MKMGKQIVWTFVATLATILVSSCNNEGDLPKQVSRNDYEYIFTVSADKGDLQVKYTFDTDGTEIIWGEGAKVLHNNSGYPSNIQEGETKTYSFKIKQAKRVLVKGEIKTDGGAGAKGSYLFRERCNGKVVRNKKEVIALVHNGESQSFEYTSSTL